MKIYLAAALALAAASSLQAQTTSGLPAIDYSTAVPMDGTWQYSTLPIGSEARFVNSTGQTQIAMRCVRSARSVTLFKPSSAAAAFISVWTTAQTRSLAASFDPATGQLRASLAAWDPLLDAITFSRGRVEFSVAGQPALVVPSWAEAARVVEDCRV
jgi:hypothetical protein